MRPDIEQLPWDSLSIEGLPSNTIEAARKAWTSMAFQEFRTAAACSQTLSTLIEARAPIDLIALLSRFCIDEMVHVELCARVTTQLGGAVELAYNPKELTHDFNQYNDSIVKSAHMIVAYFCVGEALSIPLLHHSSLAATQPLMKQVLRTIVKDEADHGTFGWQFLEWASPFLSEQDKIALGETAPKFITSAQATWLELESKSEQQIEQANDLGWMGLDEYLKLARQSLIKQVLEPLQQHGIKPILNNEQKSNENVNPISAQIVLS